MYYDILKTTNPDDEWLGPDPYDEALERDRPCEFEKFSGECLRCGACLGERCEITGEVNE